MKRKLYANTKRFTTVFCVCIGAVTALMLVVRLTLFRDAVAAADTPESTTAIVDGRDTLFDYRFNSKVYFSSPTARGDVYLENPSSNNCLLTIAILDTYTEDNYIYTGFMNPGDILETLPLNLELDEDIYDCIIEINAYDPDTREHLGKVEDGVTLFVGTKPIA